MTMPFAPGGSPGQPQYQPPMQPGFQYAQQPGYAPPPAYSQAPPPGFQQPQPQYQPQQPQQMPQQLQGSDLNQRLYGPGIPAELQGKTVGEGLRYYGIMREEFIRRGQQQPQQPQAQPQQQPQQQFQQQPQGQPSAQPRGPQQPQGDPMRQYVEEAIRQVMPEMLAPVVQPIQQQNLQRIYQETKSRYPDWQQHEAAIIQSMQGADPQTLSNPAAWEAAYRHAVGDAVVRQRQGQQPQQAPGYQPYGFGGQPQQQLPPQFDSQAQYRPPQMQGANGAPTFVESPTPPPPQMPQQGYDPADEMAAKRFNIPVEVYRSWKGGRIGLLHQPAQGIQAQTPYGQPVQQPQPQMQGYPPQPQYPPQGFPQVPPGYYQPPTQNGVGYNGRY
jgi:hypothetical protein